LHNRKRNMRKDMAFNKLIFVFFCLVCIVLISIVLLDAKFNFSASFRQLLPFQQLEIKGTKETHPAYYKNVLPKRFQWKGNAYPCFRGAFKEVLIVVTYNSPFYDNIDIINRLYENVFGIVVHCGIEANGGNGMQPDIIADVGNGHRGYVCMARAIEKYPDFQGYLYVNDDMIVNWWRLLEFDRKKVWQGPKQVEFNQDAYGEIVNKEWMWWTYPIGLPACQKSYEILKGLAKETNDFNAETALKIYLKNGEGRPRCGKGWSDFFYVPKHLAKTAQKLLEIYEKNKLFLEMAVMNLLHSLDYKENLEIVNGVFLPDLGLINPADGKEFWGTYDTTVTFYHPFKFGYKDFAAMNLALVKNWILDITRSLTEC